MRRFVVLDKRVGETPLEAVKRWKDAHPSYAEVPASYAGRLDPMASGALLVLLGEECKRQERYTGLDKEYEVEVLLDAGSDTGDVLGVVASSARETRADRASLESLLKREEGRHTRAYPAYSSKTVNGKPLFLYALENTIGEIEIPTHEERIYRLRLLGVRSLPKSHLQLEIDRLLALAPTTAGPEKALGADFRIGEVRASWGRLFAEAPERSYAVLRLRVACGPGTYMRSLAGRIGESLGTSALALSIRRTAIGRRRFGVWLTEYR